MLKFMRKHATSYMIKAMFALIIIVFIFWGVGSFRGRERLVAQIGPYKVYYPEYNETYNRLLNFYRALYRDALDENVLQSLKLKEKAVDDIIYRYLLFKKADEAGITVSDDDFFNHLTTMDIFKRGGKFDKKVYIEVLKRNGIDPKRFEESEKMSLAITKITCIINDTGVFLTESDIWTSFIKEKGMVKLGFIKFDPDAYKKQITIDNNEILSIYEKEKNTYKGEDEYHLRYITINMGNTLKDDMVYLELLKVKDMVAYGKEKGLSVIDLGMMKEGELLKRFKHLRIDEWLKSLKKGDISLPQRTESQSLIFQLVNIEPGKPFDKEIALQRIRNRLITEKAKTQARAKAEDVIANKNLHNSQETPFLSRGASMIPGIGPVPQEHIGILRLTKNRPIYEKPVEINGIFYVFYFKDEKLPDRKVWEKEKDIYRKYLIVKHREDFYKSFLEDLRSKEKIKIYWENL